MMMADWTRTGKKATFELVRVGKDFWKRGALVSFVAKGALPGARSVPTTSSARRSPGAQAASPKFSATCRECFAQFGCDESQIAAGKLLWLCEAEEGPVAFFFFGMTRDSKRELAFSRYLAIRHGALGPGGNRAGEEIEAQ